VLDELELVVRRVVRVARALEAGVELVDLNENLPCLCLLGADRRVARRAAGGDAGENEGNQDDCGLSL
jgi:hypothetical protein